MGLECAIVHDFFKGPCIVEWIGIEVAPPRKVVDPDVDDVEEASNEKLIVALEIMACCLVLLHV